MSCTWNSSMDGKENEKLLKCCAVDLIEFFSFFSKAQRSTCSGEQLFGKVQKLPKNNVLLWCKELRAHFQCYQILDKKKSLKLKNWSKMEFEEFLIWEEEVKKNREKRQKSRVNKKRGNMFYNCSLSRFFFGYYCLWWRFLSLVVINSASWKKSRSLIFELCNLSLSKVSFLCAAATSSFLKRLFCAELYSHWWPLSLRELGRSYVRIFFLAWRLMQTSPSSNTESAQKVIYVV